MKITAVSGPNSVPQSISPTQSASAERIAAAKAAFEGQPAPIKLTPSETPVDESITAAANNIKRIKISTNASPDRAIYDPIQEKSTISDVGETVKPEVEVTAPVNPELAHLSKQRRALQIRERELAAREKAVETKLNLPDQTQFVSKADLKARALDVLLENGVTYDDLTSQILNKQNISPEINKLREEVKALKEGLDKTLSDKDTQAERAVLTELRRETDRLSQDENFELIRASSSQADVVDLIRRAYYTDKKQGVENPEIMSVKEAMGLIENELVIDAEKYARLKKVQSRLVTSPTPQAVTTTQQPKTIRTLTSRDLVSPVLDRRSRAMAAFHGNLKK